jgi:Trypsin-co-occurring domain 2
MMSMTNPSTIGIKELISRIKEELLQDHDTTAPLFVISKVSMTVTFTVERSFDGRINLQVIEAGGNHKTEEVQSVTLELQPLIEPKQVQATLTPTQTKTAQEGLTREFYTAQ